MVHSGRPQAARIYRKRGDVENDLHRVDVYGCHNPYNKPQIGTDGTLAT